MLIVSEIVLFFTNCNYSYAVSLYVTACTVQLFAWNVITVCHIVIGLRWACLSSAGLIAVGSSLRCVTDDPYAAKWQVTC